jgi:hypothetical protein
MSTTPKEKSAIWANFRTWWVDNLGKKRINSIQQSANDIIKNLTRFWIIVKVEANFIDFTKDEFSYFLIN